MAPPARQCAVLLTLFLLPSLFAQTANLSLSSAVGSPGDTVTLDVSLGGGAGPSALQWDLGYPVADVAFDSAGVGPAATTIESRKLL